MANPNKRLALHDFVEVDGDDVSYWAKGVELASEHERVEVGGFTPSGRDEYLAGRTEQGVTVTFNMSPDLHNILWPIHRDRTIVTFKWRENMNAAVSADNQQLEGDVQILSYPRGAARGEVEEAAIVFTAVGDTGLDYHTT